ncbi:photosynthetic complex putative assembly protein PuhB [Erythrobacter sp. GH1-10]|uniref:photosynthetic complex putative assembly protein PuhB n=1 Tax=Erythrobacter sp. GH1-10 TaxID=3349334 RepID=UPI00387815C2
MSNDLHELPELDHPDVAGHGPAADGDPMGTPAPDEKVLWKGRPDRSLLARTAFHSWSVAIYFVVLIGLALAFGNAAGAIVCAVLGVLGLAVLQGLAWLSARSTLYILTNERLIMRIGMAIETRINVPLKHVQAAHLKPRGKGHGDIALELNGDRLLGYVLLWPHVRPWKFAMPQPMLRAIPDAEGVAKQLADACSAFNRIEQNLTEIKDRTAETGKQENGPAPRPAKAGELADRGLRGAPA